MHKTILNPADLPNIPEGCTLYLDVETTNIASRGKVKDSTVWYGDRICGAAVTFDDCPDCWYIPVRHTTGPNMSVLHFRQWLKDAVIRPKKWVNHNIKFDAHFAAADGAEFNCGLVDTMVQARIIHNNLKSYSLKNLCGQYLNIKNWKDPIVDWLKEHKTNNWADLPVLLIANYACQDVDNNRKLYHKFNELMPEECSKLWQMEQLVTPVLYDLEAQGMQIDPNKLAQEIELSLRKQEQLQAALDKRIGRIINVNSNKQLKKLLLDDLALPIVAWTNKENPSFNSEAMGLYESLPKVLSNNNIRSILKDIAALVEEKHFYSLFLKGYNSLHVDGVVHPDYSQCKKTGRMGCRQPNSQQLNNRAKKLVKCLPGYNIWSWDYNQIEYRLIVHYTKNQEAIRAYNENPDTDYHTWVAELADIPRHPAKTLNFLMAFGGGKNKAMEFLAKIEEVIDEVNEEVNNILDAYGGSHLLEKVYHHVADDRANLFQTQFALKAEKIYNNYHNAQPELKRTLWAAGNVAKSRGYVRTIMNRRSYIPADLSYKAFNAVIQGSAADIFKERLVQYAPRYNKTIKDLGIKPFAIVHDDIVSQVPADIERRPYVEYTTKILQNIPFELAVPIIVNREKHLMNWGD